VGESPRLGVRFFLFEDDGTLRRIPLRVANALGISDERLPQYAGKKMRVATVVVELAQGKPIRVCRIVGDVWRFDAAGHLVLGYGDAETNLWAKADAAGAPEEAGGVVDIRSRQARRQWKRRTGWEPRSGDITRLVHQIWPEAAGRPVEPAPFVTGTKKRKPSMTWESKRALHQVREHVTGARYALEELKEPSLKALIGQVDEDLPREEHLDRPLWEGVRAAAERKLQSLKTWRSGKGRWYAYVEKMVAEPDRNVFVGQTVEYRECDGKREAVRAARELLAKHAHLFDDGVMIEAGIAPDGEWLKPDFLPSGIER
jgi:hypothetical protein